MRLLVPAAQTEERTLVTWTNLHEMAAETEDVSCNYIADVGETDQTGLQTDVMLGWINNWDIVKEEKGNEDETHKDLDEIARGRFALSVRYVCLRVRLESAEQQQEC